MPFFLTSFLQKRLLRYALSQLGLLDTDALDLERLEIEWGKNSTVEIKDVALHTQVRLNDLIGCCYFGRLIRNTNQSL